MPGLTNLDGACWPADLLNPDGGSTIWLSNLYCHKNVLIQKIPLCAKIECGLLTLHSRITCIRVTSAYTYGVWWWVNAPADKWCYNILCTHVSWAAVWLSKDYLENASVDHISSVGRVSPCVRRFTNPLLLRIEGWLVHHCALLIRFPKPENFGCPTAVAIGWI